MPTRCPIYALITLAGTLAGVSAAQPVDPWSMTGRDFAGVRFPLEPVPGLVEAKSRRAWVWEEPAEGLYPLRRLHVDGYVTLVLGGFEFQASKASLWLLRLDEPGEVYQVFAFMQDVRTPRADPAVAVEATTLAVQGVLRLQAPIALRTDLMQQGRPDDPFVSAAERELAVYLRTLRGVPTIAHAQPVEPEQTAVDAAELQRLFARLEPVIERRPIFESGGTVSLAAGNVVAVSTPEETAVMLTDGVSVLYQGREAGGRLPGSLQMQAQRGVVFLPADVLTSQGLSGLRAESIRGIYLEGEVMATDGQYTVRGPSVYYDLQNDRAIVLDAVFWSYDQRQQMPLYIRAGAVRQRSADEFAAERVTLSNTAFARPNFAIGARSMTLTRRRDPEGATDYHLDARDLTLQAFGVPVLWLPRYAGDPINRPLRGVQIDSSSGGVAVKTTWNALAILGIDAPKGLEVDLLIDGYFERGFGVGAQVYWDQAELKGELLAYMLPHDSGEDRLRTGRDEDPPESFRGLVNLRQRFTLDSFWSLWLDANYASDENFIDGLFDNMQYDRLPPSTGAYLRRIQENTFLSIEARGNLNDFLVNDTQLQVPGYMTEKLPEVLYARQADDLLPDIAPGLLTWSSEYRASRLSLSFHEPEARRNGYVTQTQAMRAFGVSPDESIGDRLRAAGYFESEVYRLDTRQELIAKFTLAGFTITPMATGRITFWDDRFEEFSPDEDDRVRFWGGAGARVATSLIRVYDDVHSRALGIHRLRHIVEPSATVWRGWTTIDRGDLPVYDDEVESLLEGTLFRIGLNQTLQTQRGGPGRWRSVDLFTLNAEWVTSSGAGDDAVIGRYYEFRPELSRPGDFASVEAMWRFSDVVAASGSWIYDAERRRTARSSIGLFFDHSPISSTSIEFRSIDPIDARYLDIVNSTMIGDKYRIFSSVSYDFDENDFRRVGVELRREFQSVLVGVGVSYDVIEDRTSFGFLVSPKGIGRGIRVRGIGGGETGVAGG
ncbi:MAG: hypothetical protein KIT24_01755 [Phycisphaeraceae bacterium]|nr:hypothetical protein [Phycisphaeraceae bacterium]